MSAGSDSPDTETIAIQTTANGQTVYVTSQHSASANDDGTENLRYNPNGSGNNAPNNGDHHLRYAEDLYPDRYDYQGHQGHVPNNAEAIKIELIRNQNSALHAAKMQHNGDPQHSQAEPKIQYTNLDVSPQNYYSIATEGYQPTGSGFAYLSAGPSKDYSIYQGSPNAVLYKGEINKINDERNCKRSRGAFGNGSNFVRNVLFRRSFARFGAQQSIQWQLIGSTSGSHLRCEFNTNVGLTSPTSLYDRMQTRTALLAAHARL